MATNFAEFQDVGLTAREFLYLNWPCGHCLTSGVVVSLIGVLLGDALQRQQNPCDLPGVNHLMTLDAVGRLGLAGLPQSIQSC
jgi:hypothetical protein